MRICVCPPTYRNLSGLARSALHFKRQVRGRRLGRICLAEGLRPELSSAMKALRRRAWYEQQKYYKQRQQLEQGD